MKKLLNLNTNSILDYFGQTTIGLLHQLSYDVAKMQKDKCKLQEELISQRFWFILYKFALDEKIEVERLYRSIIDNGLLDIYRTIISYNCKVVGFNSTGRVFKQVGQGVELLTFSDFIDILTLYKKK